LGDFELKRSPVAEPTPRRPRSNDAAYTQPDQNPISKATTTGITRDSFTAAVRPSYCIRRDSTLSILSGGPAAIASPATPSITAGDSYVALGSSFAANGPTDVYDVECGRSSYNYAHLAARALQLDLTDVTCSGATLANLVDTPQSSYFSSNVRPPQLASIGPDTKLVTVTGGGNDVNNALSLMIDSCKSDPTPLEGISISRICSLTVDRAANQTALDGITAKMTKTIQAIKQKAPQARVIIVDYLTVMPDSGETCAPRMPLPREQVRYYSDLARQLAQATKKAAQRGGAEIIRASAESQSHHVCSAVPWVTGWEFGKNAGDTAPYHPNGLGQAAIAELLVEQIKGHPGK
jgi:lysophospholipase L1-like esterase